MAQESTSRNIFKAYFHPVPLRAMDSAPSQFDVSGKELQRLKKDSANLYRGIQLLQRNQPQKALPFLQSAAENMKHTVSNVSEWYLALTYLKIGKIAQAEYMFHKIAETEIHPHQDDAELIYQRLTKK